MKKFRTSFLAVACAIFTMGGLSSCLGDGDGNSYKGMTPAEKHQACLDVSGSYSGKIFFKNSAATNTSKTDSTDMSLTVIDSTLTIRNFPVRVLSEYVTGAAAKATLAQAGDIEVKGRVSYYQMYSSTTASKGNYYLAQFLPCYDGNADTNGKVNFIFDSVDTDIDGNQVTRNNTATLTFMYLLPENNPQYMSAFETQNGKMNVTILVKKIELNGQSYTVESGMSARMSK